MVIFHSYVSLPEGNGKSTVNEDCSIATFDYRNRPHHLPHFCFAILGGMPVIIRYAHVDMIENDGGTRTIDVNHRNAQKMIEWWILISHFPFLMNSRTIWFTNFVVNVCLILLPTLLHVWIRTESPGNRRQIHESDWNWQIHLNHSKWLE